MKAVQVTQEFAVPEDKPFDSCHASTLVELKGGGILVAYFGGSWEKAPDTAIWVSRKRGQAWEYPRVAADIRGVPLWNPVLFRRNDGSIRLFFKAGKEISEWKTYFSDSYDEGESFTPPAELVPGDESGGRGPVKKQADTAEKRHGSGPRFPGSRRYMGLLCGYFRRRLRQLDKKRSGAPSPGAASPGRQHGRANHTPALRTAFALWQGDDSADPVGG